MSKFLPNYLVLETEPDSVCSMCGKTAECRPYGIDSASICYECGETIPDVVDMQVQKRLGIVFDPELVN